MALRMKRAAVAMTIALFAGVSLAAIPAAQAAPSHIGASAKATPAEVCRSVTRGMPARSSAPPRDLKPAAPNAVLCWWVIADTYDAASLGWAVALQFCTDDGQFYLDNNPAVVSRFMCVRTSTGYQLWLLVCISTRTPPQAETWINVNSQKAMEVNHSSTANGATVDQWPYNGTDTQWWIRAENKNGYNLVVNVNSGKCLGIGGGVTSSRAPVVQWECNGNPDQKWAWQGTGATNSGWPVYNIVNYNSGLCIDVPNSSTAQGQALQQYGCNGTNAQAWY